MSASTAAKNCVAMQARQVRRKRSVVATAADPPEGFSIRLPPGVKGGDECDKGVNETGVSGLPPFGLDGNAAHLTSDGWHDVELPA